MVDCGTSAGCVPNEASTNTLYYFSDRLGNVLAVTDNTGAIQQRFFYTPFGVEMVGNATGNPFRYTGRRYDAETGLYYYRARYYDADLGRFLQVDPIGYADQWNLYAYVGNNPLNATDPTGMVQQVSVSGSGELATPVGGAKVGGGATYDYEHQTITFRAEIGPRAGERASLEGRVQITDSPSEAAQTGFAVNVVGEASGDAVLGGGSVTTSAGYSSTDGFQFQAPTAEIHAAVEIDNGGHARLAAGGSGGVSLQGEVTLNVPDAVIETGQAVRDGVAAVDGAMNGAAERTQRAGGVVNVLRRNTYQDTIRMGGN